MVRSFAIAFLLLPLVQGNEVEKPGHRAKAKVNSENAKHEAAPEALAEVTTESSWITSEAESQSLMLAEMELGSEATRPKLSGGCASSHTNLVAGTATLALAAFWFLALQSLLARDIPADAGAGRLAVLDTCKFLLMIPVINQHTTFWFGPRVLQGTMQYVHFHTRTFCFVSGLTAQGLPTEKSIKSVVFRLIAPTMLWTLVGFLYFDRETLKNRPAQQQLTYLFQGFLMAPGISWYMYALVCWRIAGWGLMSMKPVVRCAASLMIMIMSGYIIDSPGFLRNAGIYLPIFLAGQLFPLKEVMARIPVLTPPMFISGLAILLLTATWEYSASGLAFLSEIPFYSWGRLEGPPDGYCSFGAFSTFWLRGLFRNALEVSKGLVLILLCCPRQDNLLSRLGQYSLYTYLLHPWCQDFVNKGIKIYDWRPHPTAASSASFQWACVLGAIAYAVAMNMFLTSWPVRTLFGPILEPTWLERLFGAEPKESKPKDSLPTYGACKA